jgi:membrane protease YdiL (CAAX protease family)
MTLLAQSWKKSYRVGKIEISSSGLWATFLFMFGHISTFSIAQQLSSFGLGLYYAIVFHKTKSLLGPILSHGYSNGIIFIALYVLFFTMH